MLRYILKRILLFIPTLFAISLLAFIISINSPGDPVDRLLNAGNDGEMNQSSSNLEKLKRQKRHELGLDLPVFYFSLGTLADVDTLYKITDKEERETVERLIYQTGNKDKVIAYYTSLKNALLAHDNLHFEANKNNPESLEEIITESKNAIENLLQMHQQELIFSKLDSQEKLVKENAVLQPLTPYITSAKNAFNALQNNKRTWKTYIPSLNIYGFKNQYHRWITNIIFRQDFGVSYRDQQPVFKRIGDKFKWSFVLTFFSVIIAYLLSIPIGVYSAYKRNTWFDKFSAATLFMLYSMPTAFVGTLLLVLFANPDFLNWFPESGVQSEIFDPNWPLIHKIQHWAPYLILPIITYTYTSLAFISRQMRSAMLENLNQDYIQTARAKGISEYNVIWKHALRNSLLPIITLFTNVFPLAIGGSIIVETIFGIPWMGLEIYESIRNYDYPMIVAVFTIFGVLTLVGYLLADILYVLADPRISYRDK
ncbi:MAG: ABC transporter permease [Sphingobacteriales bacterium]|nr:MAG: ABC transporter permease [Sphingobacteriales bacterium]